MPNKILTLCISSIVFISIIPSLLAQENADTWREKINRGTISVISGGINGTYIRVATDLASVLDDGYELRVLPIMGKGSVQNIDDILYLKGIDIGIVQSDVFEFIKSQNKHPSIDQRIRYITKLYNEEFHLLAEGNISDIADLAGKKVNFGVEGSGTFMTASLVFDILGIDVEIASFDQGLALEKIKSGEISATVYVAGKPTQLLQNIAAGSGLGLLEVPLTPELLEIYLPAQFSGEDYPNLLGDGERVKTIAVGAVLAVYNWKKDGVRYNKVSRFVEAFFQEFAKFQFPPRHPKWREVSLTAEVPGWQRFGPAKEMLERIALLDSKSVRDAFAEFLKNVSPNLAEKFQTEKEKEQLLQLFIQWKNAGAQ